MKAFKALFWKDFRNANKNFGPALLLSLPLLLLLQFSDGVEPEQSLAWTSAFWVVVFISTTTLFYRSFNIEHQYQNFHIYLALRVPRMLIFLSQCLWHFLSGILLAFTYLLLVFLFWTPDQLEWLWMITLIIAVQASLSPVGTLLGLALQKEREFLFSIFYLPLVTPIFLAAHSLSLEYSAGWFSILGAFFLLGSFISACIFEFFFDELTENDY